MLNVREVPGSIPGSPLLFSQTRDPDDGCRVSGALRLPPLPLPPLLLWMLEEWVDGLVRIQGLDVRYYVLAVVRAFPENLDAQCRRRRDTPAG